MEPCIGIHSANNVSGGKVRAPAARLRHRLVLEIARDARLLLPLGYP
jgi:hypothetical protein